MPYISHGMITSCRCDMPPDLPIWQMPHISRVTIWAAVHGLLPFALHQTLMAVTHVLEEISQIPSGKPTVLAMGCRMHLMPVLRCDGLELAMGGRKHLRS